MSYALDYPIAAHAGHLERAAFIRRTYSHLAGAILAFMGLEFLLLNIPNVENVILRPMLSGGWIFVILMVMAAGWLAQSLAHARTPATQYAGLALYVVVEAVIFLPLLYLAKNSVSPQVIPTAGILTLAVFAGLTTTVFVTGKDYSSLAPILSCGGWLVLGLIVCSLLFGMNLGLWFSFLVVGLACGYIIYDTSNVLHHYPTNMHVGAALQLFASVMLLFYYILRILMATQSRD